MRCRVLVLLLAGALLVGSTWAMDTLHQERLDYAYGKMIVDWEHRAVLRHNQENLCALYAVAKQLDEAGSVDPEDFRSIMEQCYGFVEEE